MHRLGATPAQDPQLDRLYIAVRGDLSPGLASAQAVHAAFSFALAHPEATQAWMHDSKYLVIVAVPDETSLIGLVSKALARDVAVAAWHEPDMADSLTAVALEPGALARRLCANLPLYGRPPLAATG